MSRYRTYGKLDDPFVTEGDTFFLRMNSRLRANQLKVGEVAVSENGRMSDDGTWQPRKGLATIFGSITAGDSLRLPFTVLRAQRLNNQVIITLNETPNLAFYPGNDIHVDNIVFTNTPDPNGTHILESVNFFTKTIIFNQTGPDDDTFTIRTDTDASTTIVAPGASNPTELDFIVNDEGVNEVYGSAVFTDAASQADDFIFTATNQQCFIVRLKDRALFKVRYDAGSETINRPCGMLQANNKMYIFRGQESTLECSPSITYLDIASVSQSGQVITINTNTAHGRNVGDFITITNLGGWDDYDPDGVYEVKTSSTNSLTVEMLDSQTVASFNISGTEIAHFADFTEVASGAYTAPAYYTDTTATAASGVVTMDVGNHVIEPGDTLVIRNGASPYDLYIGQEVVVTSVTDTNGDTFNDRFTFNLGVQDEPGASLTVSKRLAIGKGFIHQPGAEFGVVAGGRLWLPYFYTSANTPIDRNTRTEIVASDVLDFDTYDVIGNQFNITAGQSDYIVALEPFQDQLIVFMRKSIHVINGITGSLADCTTTLLTTEVGCSARKTIVQVANKIYFLSDKGLYAIEYFDEVNLRGVGVPITETIQPIMDRINQNYSFLSTAVYHNNRIFLATVLDSVPGANNAYKVNTVIVWNLLNGGVESIDTVDSLDFSIRDFIVGREGAQNELYLTTEEGGIHKVEANDGGDVVSLVSGAQDETIPVVSRLVTRQYDADSLDRKQFSRAELQLKGENIDPSDAEITFISEDPDSSTTVGNVSDFLGSTLPAGEEASIRTRVRKRGFGIQAQVRATTGRPFVRSVKVEARLHDRSTTSVS
jgi:hypothetical protein